MKEKQNEQTLAPASELSEIINRARERGCAEHGPEIKWLYELPMTDEEAKRFNDLTGWSARKTNPDSSDSTLSGDEAFGHAWSAMVMLKRDLDALSETHLKLSRAAWSEAVLRMESARDKLAAHHARYNP